MSEALFYYNAYHELGTCRTIEGGLIPWTAVKVYAEHYELTDDMLDTLFTVCVTVDLAMLETDNGKSSHNGPPIDADKSKRTNAGYRGSR